MVESLAKSPASIAIAGLVARVLIVPAGLLAIALAKYSHWNSYDLPVALRIVIAVIGLPVFIWFIWMLVKGAADAPQVLSKPVDTPRTTFRREAMAFMIAIPYLMTAYQVFLDFDVFSRLAAFFGAPELAPDPWAAFTALLVVQIVVGLMGLRLRSS